MVVRDGYPRGRGATYPSARARAAGEAGAQIERANRRMWLEIGMGEGPSERRSSRDVEMCEGLTAEEKLVGAVPVAGGGTGVASPPLNSANEAEKDDDSAPVGGAENDVSVAESLAAPCG